MKVGLQKFLMSGCAAAGGVICPRLWLCGGQSH